MIIKLKRPQCLQKGDKVAIVSPSSGMAACFPWVYEQGLSRIKNNFQLTPIEFPTARQTSSYLSKNPQARADDINNAFADPSIKAIIATIGGNDQIKILPFLDPTIISSNPKIFMGYSDCTNLHLFLWNLGIISYYGGAVMTQFANGITMNKYTVEHLEHVLFNQKLTSTLYAATEYTDADLNWEDQENWNKDYPMHHSNGWYWHNANDQIIEGRLWGGCLEVLNTHLSVKKYLPDFKNIGDLILFIETSEDMPSDKFVYSFIITLAELGILNKVKAILSAYPKAQFLGKKPPEGRDAYIINQQIAIKQALQDLDAHIPVIFNMNFGHTDPQIIIPSGGIAKINCITKTIKLKNKFEITLKS